MILRVKSSADSSKSFAAALSNSHQHPLSRSGCNGVIQQRNICSACCKLELSFPSESSLSVASFGSSSALGVVDLESLRWSLFKRLRSLRFLRRHSLVSKTSQCFFLLTWRPLWLFTVTTLSSPTTTVPELLKMFTVKRLQFLELENPWMLVIVAGIRLNRCVFLGSVLYLCAPKVAT